MAKDPAVLFYYQDFIVGTEFMTDDEIGKYIKLLCYQADKGKLTKKQVLSICSASAFPDFVHEKFLVDKNGLYYNGRMLEEKEKRLKFTESRRNNALSPKAYAQHMEDEDININKDIINKKIPFENFWNLYDKKTGKPKSEKKWNKLSLTDQTKAMEFIPRYKIAQPDKQYRKNPETFLNNESWNDEIVGKKKEEGYQATGAKPCTSCGKLTSSVIDGKPACNFEHRIGELK